MASSDDEGETFPDAASDYYFCDGEDEPVSFSKLAVQWNESESSSGIAGPIFLRGTADNGLQTLYKRVKAWKYDVSKANPEISVLSKDNNWIKLQKPRKSFENEIRTILISVHCLHFFKSKPDASGKALWDHLSKVFSLYDVRPSENDLIDHMNFIRESVKRDETLAKSKFLAQILEENPRMRKVPDKNAETATKPSFIVDDMNDEPLDDDFITKETKDSESDEEEDVFDSVCAICDNGGKLTCCEGKCLRSFHATVESEEAQESNCESLGLPAEVVKGTQPFFCENCQYNQHQCFACGKLGSSDKSSVAEVFRCSSATCGHFYHPQCVATLLEREGEPKRQDLQEKITAGEPFTCPAHKCVICKQAENEEVKDLQFAICRRCPTSYHRKCLPRGIMFDNEVGDDDLARAWDGLLPKSRALIYCLEHEIDEELGTPARNLKFRDIGHSKAKPPSELPSNKKKVAVKEKGTNSEYTSKKMSVLKSQKGVEKSSAVKLVDSSKKRVVISPGPESSKKKKVADTSKNSLKRTLSTKVKTPSFNDSQPSLGSRLYKYMYSGTEPNNSEKEGTSVDDDNQTVAATSLQKESLPPVDEDSKQRILALMKDAASSITLDEVKKYHKGKVPSTHVHSSRVDKSIILARVEGSVEALHVALKKLEEGCSIEDAIAVCEPSVLEQIMRWKEKLKVYLAPFLHGMRYTSFGRHFTKVEKLEKIVDKLRWYVEDGDTVVDFCCGANDFSCLVKKRLDEMGRKRCSYKNYDITRPKNDFNFQKRDWMTVAPKELPCGSRLIMGLNPPFGKNAALANQFIDRALQFKPKLVVLIVPPETERLDKKRRIPYDLVWEDAELLAGKSFYLPGSVDVNDKQMDQWNHTPPPLYLWSRPDWTSKHKAIAQQHGHISEVKEAPRSDENVPALDPSNGNNELEGELPVPLCDRRVINKDSEQTTDKAKAKKKRSAKEGSARDNGGIETKQKQIIREKKSNQNSKKRNRRSQELRVEKRDGKHSSAPPRQGQVHETLHLDISFGNDAGKSFDQHLERRYKSTTEEPYVSTVYRHSPAPPHQDQVHEAPHSDFSFGNDAGKSFDQHLERRYNSTTEEPYVSTVYRHSPVPPRQDEVHETPHSDFSFGNNAGESFDQYLERRYNSTTEEPYASTVYRHSPAPPRQDQVHGAPHSDFSFGNDAGKSFDQHLERRYNSTTEEPYRSTVYRHSPAPPRQDQVQETPHSDLSFGNDAGKSFDQHLERRYNSATEEPYVTTVYRQPEGASLATAGYAKRPDQVQYPGYDRGGRGSYFDEMSARSGYISGRHELSARYGPADASSYNRMSTSAMQRYAPRLDELNHTRMSNMGRPEPPTAGRGMGGYGLPFPGPGYHNDSLGFAPGPYHNYSQHNSSGGWLND